MILTKSAHRFARNTVDALKTIRMLRRRNIDIYFEQEDIHSLYESSELMLTLICARAQEESFSKSEDIKWGLRKSFKNPDSQYYYFRTERSEVIFAMFCGCRCIWRRAKRPKSKNIISEFKMQK